MVELRKRKTPSQPPPTEKKTKTAPKQKEQKEQKDDQGKDQDKDSRVLNAGDTITLDGFGGEIETNDGTKTTLKKLMDESDSGVVLFTYPKASTPGCKLLRRIAC